MLQEIVARDKEKFIPDNLFKGMRQLERAFLYPWKGFLFENKVTKIHAGYSKALILEGKQHNTDTESGIKSKNGDALYKSILAPYNHIFLDSL